MRNLFGLAVIALASSFVACSAGDPGIGAQQHPSTDAGAVSVFPTKAFTGVEDQGMKYVLPIAVSGGTKVVWSSSDPTVAAVAGDDASAKVTAVKVGTVTITATSGTRSATVSVTVEAYAASGKAAGAAAYDTFKCASCHAAANGPDITPSGIGKHEDAEIMAAVTAGAKPEGGEISLGAKNHSFAIAQSDAAYSGLVAYLRALPARKSQPAAD